MAITHRTRLWVFALLVGLPLLATASDFDYAAYKRSTIPDILPQSNGMPTNGTP